MKKEEFKELCDTSEKVLGHKYAWRKLRTKGIIDRSVVPPRRVPLTVEGVKHYMKTRQEALEKMIKEKAND